MKESWFVLLSAVVAQYQDGEFVFSLEDLEVIANGAV